MKRLALLLMACCTALIFTIAANAETPITYSSDGTVTHSNLNPDGSGRSPYRQVPDEILVRFREFTPAAFRAQTHVWHGTRAVKEFKAVKDLQLVKLPRGMTVHQALKAFRKAPEVLYAEPNYIVNTFVTPNDTRFSELWGLHNTGQTGGIADADIDAPEAWNLTTGSANTVLAVIDTGVDYTHQDLGMNMFRNAADCNTNGSDDDDNGYVDDCYGIDTINNDSDPMDDEGHGTHVSGTIGAVGNNAGGVVGVNWAANILACKFLDSTGHGDTAGAIACLDYIATMKDRGVNIVASNNSWGGGAYSYALRDAIDAQRQRGILFVAAAGNDYSDNEILQTYPCSYYLPNVLCVASTNASDNRSGFSNYGKRIVHLGAPGEGVLSTVPASVDSSGYALSSGTSMATPHVTGVVGLIHSSYPGSDWRAVKNRILAGGDLKSALNQTITGRRLNAYGALTCSNSTVLSRVRPLGSTLTFGPGTPIELASLHINCANPNGNVTVTVSPTGETMTLLDDGLGSDLVAGDGLYSGSWTPLSGGTFTIAFPGGDNVTVNVDPDLQPGFPVKAWHGGGSYHSGQAIHTLVADVDGNPGLEIFATSLATGPLNAWNSAGMLLSGWPIETAGAAYPAVGELSIESSGDEVFFATYGSEPDLFAHNGSGSALSGWPRTSANYVATPPSLADVDGDGLDEIFIEEEDWKLHAYRADGAVLSGWPVWGLSSQERHTPAIGDLDGDSDLEIISASGGANPVTLYAYHSSGAVVTGFPVSFTGYADTYPVMGDVDGDAQKEIIVVDYYFDGTTGISRALIYSAGGVLKRLIPLSGSVFFGAAPALADLDDDGKPEIIVQTNSALNVVRGDGTNYPGWPVVWGDTYWLGNSSPVVGDVDGDGFPDIIVTTQVAGSGANGVLRVYGRNGVSHPRFPKTLAIGSGAVPAIADIDNDGHNEIVITGSYWGGYSGYYDKAWVYDLGGPAHGPVLWGQFMGNARHTGVYSPAPAPQPDYYMLNVTIVGDGSVTSSPDGISCGSNCSELYLSGTTVVLTAITSTGSSIAAWSGACTGTNTTCTITMDSSKEVIAEFTAIPPASSATLTASPANAQIVGSSVTFTATASGGSGSYEYHFRVVNNGVLLAQRSYGASNTWTWNTTGVTPGTYTVQVRVRNAGSTAAYEAYWNIFYSVVTSPPATGATLTVVSAAPIAGVPVSFGATASGGSGNYEYRFRVLNGSGSEIAGQSYGTTDSWTWDTTGAAVGSYTAQVRVRNIGSTAAYEAFKNIIYTIMPLPATGATLTASPASSQLVGNLVNFIATGSGGSGTYEYHFRVVNNGTLIAERPYNTTNTWTWNTTGVTPATYTVQVRVRSAGSTAIYEAYWNILYSIVTSAPATGATLSASPANSQIAGQPVLFTAGGSGGSGSYEYRFRVLNNGVEIAQRSFGASNTWTWNTTGVTPGTYIVQVRVRNTGSPADYEAYANIRYSVVSP